jgi:hypothetical protein
MLGINLATDAKPLAGREHQLNHIAVDPTSAAQLQLGKTRRRCPSRRLLATGPRRRALTRPVS